MAVLGVMAMLVVYLVTVQGSVLMTASLGKLEAQRQQRAEAVPSLILQARTAAESTTTPLSLETPNGLTVRLGRRQLAAGDPLWQQLRGLAPVQGDELVTIIWEQEGIKPQRYLFNPRRRGLIRLGEQTAAQTADTESGQKQPDQHGEQPQSNN